MTGINTGKVTKEHLVSKAKRAGGLSEDTRSPPPIDTRKQMKSPVAGPFIRLIIPAGNESVPMAGGRQASARNGLLDKEYLELSEYVVQSTDLVFLKENGRAARGRPIIVEWETQGSAGLSRSVTHRYVTERYTFQSDSQPQPNLRRCRQNHAVLGIASRAGASWKRCYARLRCFDPNYGLLLRGTRAGGWADVVVTDIGGRRVNLSGYFRNTIVKRRGNMNSTTSVDTAWDNTPHAVGGSKTAPDCANIVPLLKLACRCARAIKLRKQQLVPFFTSGTSWRRNHGSPVYQLAKVLRKRCSDDCDEYMINLLAFVTTELKKCSTNRVYLTPASLPVWVSDEILHLAVNPNLDLAFYSDPGHTLDSNPRATPDFLFPLSILVQFSILTLIPLPILLPVLLQIPIPLSTRFK
ncbi:hypothetical protein EVAR_40669_1 [Eumeta japonica]|uniref:Uncharacterized protein n=1 Tax=Eumeta variegata TaxID=151549 RepID=A0A4C1X7B0_EUMVA|nr:hypothetical protein EVAR_40669_1 [Eumeta japonica]